MNKAFGFIGLKMKLSHLVSLFYQEFYSLTIELSGKKNLFS